MFGPNKPFNPINWGLRWDPLRGDPTGKIYPGGYSVEPGTGLVRDPLLGRVIGQIRGGQIVPPQP
jgi:hypothetical protein